MATENIVIQQSDGWTQVALAADEFILENPSSYIVYARFSSSQPSALETGHIVDCKSSLIRAGVSDNLWVRTDQPEDITLFISKG